MECPNDDVLAAFAEGGLSPTQRGALEQHVDECRACGELLASSVRSRAPHRYVIGRPVGRGGFADVYEAHDRELHRTVAVKVLRGHRRADVGEVRARLVREAQALARLSHPNIVEIYDVGLDGNIAGPDDDLAIVMELVRGTTLHRWLEHDRTWQEIRDVFVAAGRGLAAAHAVGIVHRDFKPSNVIVGDDGRVRVLDFGLARGSDSDLASSSDAASGSSGSLHDRLTQSGAVLGTPLYMAPEQYVGEPADARSDQYAFAVALFDALFRASPFDARDRERLVAAKLAGRITAPKDRGRVPAWLYTALVKALHREPERRFPDMPELLATLERPRPRSATIAVIASAAVVAGAVALAMPARGLDSSEDAVALASAVVRHPLADPDDPERAAEVDAVRAELEEAAAVRHAGDYADARPVLDALAARADATGFAPLRAEVQLERAMLEWMAGAEGHVDLFERAYETAVACGHFSVAANTASMLAFIAAGRGESSSAAQWAGHARVALERVDEDSDVEINVLNRLAQLDLQRGELEQAYEDLSQALALSEDRWGSDAHENLASLSNLALVTMWRGDVRRANDLHERALALSEQRLTIHREELATLLSDSAVSLDQLGDHGLARERFERSLAIALDTVGETHPMVGRTLSNLGVNAASMGDDELSIAYHRRALAVEERIRGPQGAGLVDPLQNLGEMLLETGRIDEAAPYLERAMTIATSVGRDDDAMLSPPRQVLGRLRLAQGRVDEAVDMLERALEGSEDRIEPTWIARTRFYLARARWASGRREQALAEAERARTMLAAAGESADVVEIARWMKDPG